MNRLVPTIYHYIHISVITEGTPCIMVYIVYRQLLAPHYKETYIENNQMVFSKVRPTASCMLIA